MGLGWVVGSAEQGEAGSEQVRLVRWQPSLVVAALYLSSYQDESSGEPVGSDRAAVSIFLSVGYPGPCLVIRTCGFHLSLRGNGGGSGQARRIIDGLRSPDQAPEDLLGLLTVRRGDGSEVSLEEFPLARVHGSSETVRAEEIVMGVGDGRSVSVLLNSTPIRSEGGGGVELPRSANAVGRLC